MVQAIKTPGNGIPAGTALVQPEFPGEPSLVAVRIGAEKDKHYPQELRDIAGRLGTLATEQVTAKSPTEQRWLEDLRAYHGRYDTTALQSWRDLGQSTAYMKASRSKTIALEARLYDLIFPTDDRNWSITPTPVPMLAEEKRSAERGAQDAAKHATRFAQANDPAAEAQVVAIGNENAEKAMAADELIGRFSAAAKSMQDVMDDQLVESRYPSESRKAIKDFAQLGTAILKGPMTRNSVRGNWLPDNEGGGYTLQQKPDDRPLIKRTDPWHFFPDMSAATIEDAEFTFERYLWTKSDLRKMVDKMGFDPDAVREIIRETSSKRATTDSSLSNLVALRSLTDDTTGSITGRFIGWEYHGPLECEEIVSLLRHMGDEEGAKRYELEDDPLKEHRVIVWFCEGVVLKIADEYPLDSGETLYSVGNLEEAEGTMFGYGVPRICRDSEDALNSAWRVALDNAAMSVGPMGFIDATTIAPVDGKWDFRPKKLWHRIKAAVAGDTSKPIELINIPNNMMELKVLIELASLFIDIETGIPQPQQGEQGTHTTQTFGGMAILQNAANIIFRRFVKNWDDFIITPTMRRLYDWNMQFNPRDDIKGDMQVDARGTSVLLVKEVQATNLMLVVQQLLNNPNIAPMLKAYPAVEKLFQAMMIKPSEVLIGEDEYNDLIEQMRKQPPPPSDAQINAQARIDSAKINAETAMGRDQTAAQIAQLRERTALIELAAQGDLTLAELRTMLEAKKMDTDSKERMMVAEAAMERDNAAEARARGEEPQGSGGFFSAGDGDNADSN